MKNVILIVSLLMMTHVVEAHGILGNLFRDMAEAERLKEIAAEFNKTAPVRRTAGMQLSRIEVDPGLVWHSYFLIDITQSKTSNDANVQKVLAYQSILKERVCNSSSTRHMLERNVR